MGQIRNIGPKSMAWLRGAGVDSLDDLGRLGALEVYVRVKAQNPSVNLNLLWSLEAALLDIDWRDLPEPLKAERRRELTELESVIGRSSRIDQG